MESSSQNAVEQRPMQPIIIDSKVMIEILNNFGIQLTLKDLNQPSPETINMVYRGFLETCLSLKPSDFDIPSDIILHFDEDIIKNQSESFKFLLFYTLVKYFFDMFAMRPNFTDIFMPTKKQFSKFVSAMISFARFEFSEVPDFSRAQEENKEYIKTCGEISKESDDLKGKIFSMKAEKTEKKPLIENIKKRIAFHKEKLMALREEKKKLIEANERSMKEEELVDSELEELNRKLSTIKKKDEMYEKLLVKSPERLNGAIGKIDARIIETERLIKGQSEENEGIRKMIHEREKFIENLKHMCEFLENFMNNDVQKASAQMNQISKLRTEIASLNFQLKTSESESQVLETNKAQIIKIIDELTRSFENEYQKIIEKIDGFKQCCQKNENETKEIEAEIKQANEEKKIFEQKAKANMERLLENLKTYHLNTEKVIIQQRINEDFKAQLLQQVMKDQEVLSKYVETDIIKWERINQLF